MGPIVDNLDSCPVHFLVIPKAHIASLAEVRPEHAEIFGRIMTRLPEMAAAQGLTDGWRTVINTGRVGRQAATVIADGHGDLRAVLVEINPQFPATAAETERVLKSVSNQLVHHQGKGGGLFGWQVNRGPVDGGLDLAAVADDAGVAEEALDVGLAEARHHRRVEAGEGPAEPLALAQDGEPREARLEALEAELLVQADVVHDGPAPLVVAVVHVARVLAGPPAAGAAVGAGAQPLVHAAASNAATRNSVTISVSCSGVGGAPTRPATHAGSRSFANDASTTSRARPKRITRTMGGRCGATCSRASRNRSV